MKKRGIPKAHNICWERCRAPQTLQLAEKQKTSLFR